MEALLELIPLIKAWGIVMLVFYVLVIAIVLVVLVAIFKDLFKRDEDWFEKRHDKFFEKLKRKNRK